VSIVKIFLAAVTGALLATSALIAPVAAHAASGNVRVTNDAAGPYLRYDGGSDSTTAACSTGRRSQNEPTVAVDPRNPAVVVAGSNDYCAQIVNGDVWAGYYRSTDGGQTWADSLVPGYPADGSPAGMASPAHGVCGAAGDPTQAFDTGGRLFYGFICFNRAKPVNGGIYVATYGSDGATYLRTVEVAKGSPSAQFNGSGAFQDKGNVVVDQGSSPYAGTVYVTWSRYAGKAANNAVFFSRSGDHGQSFSSPIHIDAGSGSASFADAAVGPDGAVYVTYRTYAIQGQTADAFWIVKSSDGGRTFGVPRLVASITPFSSDQFTGGTGGVDCGDGPFACPSGFTFSRFDSLSAVAADATGAHVVYAARSSSGQGKVYVRNSPDGVSWSTPASTLDAVPTGHQWTPDIASADGRLDVVFYDSRGDPGYAPNVPPGNTATGANSGDVINTFLAQSTDGGATWSETPLSTHGSNFGWETHGARRDGFWGDYIYISAVPGAVTSVWTDSRDLVPGVDPREPTATDRFDVYQPCTYVPNDINAASYSSPGIADPCLNQGGLDQNIYAARS
jgi:hypothetical protein